MVMWDKRIRTVLKPQAEIRLSDGINTYNSPFEIKKSECASCLNVSNRNYPALSTRPGSTAMYGTAAAPLTTVNAAGIRAGTTFHVQDGTAWKYWNGSAFANVATGLTNAMGKFIEFNTAANTYTILANGTEVSYSTNGTSAATLTGAPATNLYCMDDERLYALKGNKLYRCAIGIPTDWTTINDAGIWTIANLVGGTGTALAAYGDMVISWSESSMHILMGDDHTNYQFMDMIDAGCISDRSVIIHNGVLYFMDYNQFKMFTGGMPRDISQKVSTYLSNINYTYKTQIVADKWGRYIYLSIPHGSTATANNLTLEYDTELQTWHVWDIGFTTFVTISQDLYGITVSGTVKKLQQGTIDDATAITWEWVTGVWDGTPVRQSKVISDIWAVVDLPVGSTLNVSYSTETTGTSFTSLYDFTATTTVQNTRIQIPTSILQNIPWYRLKLSGVGHCIVHVLEPQIRIKP